MLYFFPLGLVSKIKIGNWALEGIPSALFSTLGRCKTSLGVYNLLLSASF